MDKNDKQTIDALLKEVAFNLGALRNSKVATAYLPDIVMKPRELELMLKGGLSELNDVELKEV
jgi:hypothetical protein